MIPSLSKILTIKYVNSFTFGKHLFFWFCRVKVILSGYSIFRQETNQNTFGYIILLKYNIQLLSCWQSQDVLTALPSVEKASLGSSMIADGCALKFILLVIKLFKQKPALLRCQTGLSLEASKYRQYLTLHYAVCSLSALFSLYFSVGFWSPTCGGIQRSNSVHDVTAILLALHRHNVMLQEDVSVNQAS